MAKIFNTAAVCIPEKHYMVNLDERLKKIRKLVDDGSYFAINRARQYGKTTTLMALERYLKKDYYVVSMDFQILGNEEFVNENTFAISFADEFLETLSRIDYFKNADARTIIDRMDSLVEKREEDYRLKALFKDLSAICRVSDKPFVLLIDEVDSAANNQVFLDFLAQLRAYYIKRELQPTFQSVILAGVYDVKNLRRKLRPDEEHKINSPWNIAADFDVDMSFSKEDIAGMLREYEADHRTGMDIAGIARLLHDYTSGYPFLVSRLCKLMDEKISEAVGFERKTDAWTKNGFLEAVKRILSEQNTLFESLTEKLLSYPELNMMLRELLFTGKTIAYNFYEPVINIATMFGFVKNDQGALAISNRIFETWLYNFYLSAADMQNKDIYRASLQDKNQFLIDGHLNMRRILERFVEHFHELYGDRDERFIEDEARSYFLLYLRPIINGTGNYYIEARTRNLRRTDIIVDYHGEQYIIELKIWHGQEYHNRGEEQLVGYMNDYHVKKGYMLSFNFNKKKEIGVKELVIGDRTLIEAVV